MKIYKDVEVSVREMSNNASGLHKHHFFELIYVLEGTGTHVINDYEYAFEEKDVFLLTPDDAHTFKIKDPCRFCIVDFTASFFSKSRSRNEEKMDVSEFFKRLEFIFHNHHNSTGNLISAAEKHVFDALIHQLILEKKGDELFGQLVTQNIIFLMLQLIARNIQRHFISDSKTRNPKNKIHEIMVYIQQNIYTKEIVTLTGIANHFNKSADHLNRYFKQQTGNTIKDYIIRYKLELIQTRLKFSDLNISEIADEMNFTDESHLNKVFRKVHGMTAKQFQQQYERPPHIH